MPIEHASRAKNPFKRFRETTAIAQSYPDVHLSLLGKVNTFVRGGRNVIRRGNHESEMRFMRHRKFDTRDRAIQYAERIVEANPFLVQRLKEAQDSSEHHIAMALLPHAKLDLNWDSFLVIGMADDQLYALLPAIACTANAVLQMKDTTDRYRKYRIFTPSDMMSSLLETLYAKSKDTNEQFSPRRYSERDEMEQFYQWAQNNYGRTNGELRWFSYHDIFPGEDYVALALIQSIRGDRLVKLDIKAQEHATK